MSAGHPGHGGSGGVHGDEGAVHEVRGGVHHLLQHHREVGDDAKLSCSMLKERTDVDTVKTKQDVL